jgi:hypothetical protein
MGHFRLSRPGPLLPESDLIITRTRNDAKGQQPTSFDQFSCLYDERVRYRDAKGFCGLEVDHEIELDRLQDRQVSRLGPLRILPT